MPSDDLDRLDEARVRLDKALVNLDAITMAAAGAGSKAALLRRLASTMYVNLRLARRAVTAVADGLGDPPPEPELAPSPDPEPEPRKPRRWRRWARRPAIRTNQSPNGR